MEIIKLNVNEEAVIAMVEEAIKQKIDELMQEKILWTIKDLCRVTSLSQATVYRLFVHDPNFPKVRIGNMWRFPVEPTKAYIERWAEEKEAKRKKAVHEGSR